MTALLARIARGPTEATPPLTPGARVGHYEIIRRLADGGFGTVYEAHDLVLNRLAAVKVLHRAEAADPAAAHEGEAAARLAHPNIAALHDAGVLEGGSPYFVYEILHGETLESRLERGPVPAGEALAIVIQVARALGHAHAHGVVHRDLKPSNVFLTAEGDVKVLDFGVALLFGRTAPKGGTPAYMAPEQHRGEAEDARTDLHALGVLLREMLTEERGGAAFGAAARVPRAVRPVLGALLAEDPAARPRSARAAIDQLETAARTLHPRRSRRLTILAAAALALIAAGTGLLTRERLLARSSAARGELPSVAVLPFADMSPGHDQAYFSDGLAEEILNALAQLEGLHVAGRTSSFSFRGSTADVSAIAAKLHVASLLEGSVRKAGDRLRITAQLVDAGTGYHLWSHTYDRKLTDVFAVQDDIARSVVEALRVKLLPSSAQPARTSRTSNPAAYDQYLIGRDLRRHASKERWKQSVAAFERATSLDPGYAAAWAELAFTWFWYGNELTRAADVDDCKRRAAEAADRAVALDPDLGEAYAVRGMLRATEHRWAEAEADLDRAVALDPGTAETHWIRGQTLLLPLGRYDDALLELRRAAELDPLWPLAWGGVGEALLARGDTGGARGMFERAVELTRGTGDIGRHMIVVTLLVDRRAPDAARLLENDPRPRSVWRVMDEALVAHALGDARASDRALGSMIAEMSGAAPFQIAEVYAWRGDRAHAFEWLDRAFAQRDAGLNELRSSPFLRGLHGDPRFAAMLRRMDLHD